MKTFNTGDAVTIKRTRQTGHVVAADTVRGLYRVAWQGQARATPGGGQTRTQIAEFASYELTSPDDTAQR